MALSSKKSLAGMKKQETLDLMMKRNKYRVTEVYQHCPMVNKKLILMYKKSPC